VGYEGKENPQGKGETAVGQVVDDVSRQGLAVRRALPGKLRLAGVGLADGAGRSLYLPVAPDCVTRRW
jgi:hypothetical protein